VPWQHQYAGQLGAAVIAVTFLSIAGMARSGGTRST
jgi:hypothetical protein